MQTNFLFTSVCVHLLAGTADKSVPFASSQLLHEALERAGVASTCKLIEGRTHTSFLLEGAMKGGRDELMELMQPVSVDAHELLNEHKCPDDE